MFYTVLFIDDAGNKFDTSFYEDRNGVVGIEGTLRDTLDYLKTHGIDAVSIVDEYGFDHTAEYI